MIPDGKILVTGADGFIGSHLVEDLALRGHEVRALVLYNSFNDWGWLEAVSPAVRQRIEIVAGDIRDAANVVDIVRGCSVVVHLAALIAIPYSYRAPSSYVETNIAGTLNVLQAVQALGVRKLVHTSTSEVYGTARFIPITEEHPLQAQSPYAASKIGADQMAMSFHASFGTPVTILRPFNTYGPRQSARAVIPTIITQLANGRRTIQLGSTHPTRDFNFVGDTVSAFRAVLESDDAVGQIFNAGSNFEVSIGETARLIAQSMSVEAEIKTADERLRPEASEVERLCADSSKLRRVTGWQPRYAGRDGLRRGLDETIAWFTDRTNLARYKVDIYNV